jgi:hypothetical protein
MPAFFLTGMAMSGAPFAPLLYRAADLLAGRDALSEADAPQNQIIGE